MGRGTPTGGYPYGGYLDGGGGTLTGGYPDRGTPPWVPPVRPGQGGTPTGGTLMGVPYLRYPCWTWTGWGIPPQVLPIGPGAMGYPNRVGLPDRVGTLGVPLTGELPNLGAP